MNIVINVSMYLSYLLEGYITYMYFSTMFEYRISRTYTRIAMYIAGFSTLYGVFLLGNSAFNMISSLVVMALLGVVVFEAPVLKSLFHSGVVSVLLVISETLVISLFNMVFSVNAASINTPPVIIIVSISSKLLLFVGCRFISSVAYKDRYRSKWSVWLMLVPVASMVTLLIIFYQSARLVLSVEENILNCTASVLLLAANLLVFHVYEKSLKNEQELSEIKLSEQRLEMDYKHYRILEENRKESRVIIHDIKHHLSLIRAMAQDKGATDISEYIDSVQKESYFSKTAVLSGNKIADIILSQKSSLCKQKGIDFRLEHNNVNLDFVSDHDLCTLISNTLDNAVEAAENSRDKFVQVRMYRSSGEGGFHFLEVVNSCDIPPEKQGNRYRTSKKGKYHGIGLYSINKVAEKYSGQVQTEYGDNKFRVTIMIQKPEL